MHILYVFLLIVTVLYKSFLESNTVYVVVLLIVINLYFQVGCLLESLVIRILAWLRPSFTRKCDSPSHGSTNASSSSYLKL